ncbi:MAG: hypothetical protein ABIJ56_11165 [Pseudomonadota bacterium]
MKRLLNILELATSVILCLMISSCWMIAGLEKTELPESDADAQDAADSVNETQECDEQSDCDDGEPCNGEEECSAEGLCVDGALLPEGRSCMTSSEREGTCVDGTCIAIGCGNGVKEPGEDCDDGNETEGDGCESDCAYSCYVTGDCDNTDPCVEEKCAENTRGRMCWKDYTDNECDDGLFCTAEDRCDEAGYCVGSGNACDDMTSCTEDRCEEGAHGPGCNNVIIPATCLISGSCYPEGSKNPGNGCEECFSPVSRTSWTRRDDMEPCDGGLCCGGLCVTGADCCATPDCGARCKGSAEPCTGFRDHAACVGQVGCAWGGESCREPSSMGRCGAVGNEADCVSCGCTWDPMSSTTPCLGDLDPCNHYDGEALCATCGCSWGDGPCLGVPADCSSFEHSFECAPQDGCFWSIIFCEDHQCLL